MPLVIAGLVLAALVMLLFGGTELDRGLIILAHADERGAWTGAARVLGAMTRAEPLLGAGLLGAGLLMVQRQWRRSGLLLAILIGGRLLLDAVQPMTVGLRPGPGERLFSAQATGFPDGHSAGAVITGFALAYLLTRVRPWRGLALYAAAGFGFAAGAARVMLGYAWPTDVIGGWATGICWVLIVLWIAGEELDDGVRVAARPTAEDRPDPGHL